MGDFARFFFLNFFKGFLIFVVGVKNNCNVLHMYLSLRIKKIVYGNNAPEDEGITKIRAYARLRTKDPWSLVLLIPSHPRVFRDELKTTKKIFVVKRCEKRRNDK